MGLEKAPSAVHVRPGQKVDVLWREGSFGERSCGRRHRAQCRRSAHLGLARRHGRRGLTGQAMAGGARPIRGPDAPLLPAGDQSSANGGEAMGLALDGDDDLVQIVVGGVDRIDGQQFVEHLLELVEPMINHVYMISNRYLPDNLFFRCQSCTALVSVVSKVLDLGPSRHGAGPPAARRAGWGRTR